MKKTMKKTMDKKATAKKPMMQKGGVKKSLPKAQKGMSVKPTADSTGYYKKEIKGYDQLIKSEPNTPIGKSNKLVYMDAKSKAYSNLNRQSLKGKPGYDKNGFPIKKSTIKKKG
jgi:hypothetical protein